MVLPRAETKEERVEGEDEDLFEESFEFPSRRHVVKFISTLLKERSEACQE